MTTKETITKWLKEGAGTKGITHMLVVCDTFSFDDYPVYVSFYENVHNIYNEHDGKNMQKVMEVYSFRQNLEKQLDEKRAFHFE